MKLEDLKNKKLFLFDMDGTIYLGNMLFDGVNELLDTITKNNKKFIFITNNSSKSVKDYLVKLNNLGIVNIDESNFYTSTQATISKIKREFNNPLIYAQGTTSFITELKKNFEVTTKYNENANLILVGFDRELNFEKMENTCKMLNLNIPYFATNPDWVCPTEYGSVPDCGSMCFGYEKATGRMPEFIGKPQPTMILEVMGNTGFTKEEVVVIGDRLYTDIASGVNAGVDTICVLSGEVKKEEVEVSDIKPSLVLKDVSLMTKYI